MRFVRGFLVVMTLWGAGSGAAQAADAPGPPRELRDVKVEQRAAAVAVTVATSGQPKYETTLLDSPVRLVIDISGTFASPRSRWTGMPEPLKEVRGSQFKPGTGASRRGTESQGRATASRKDRRASPCSSTPPQRAGDGRDLPGAEAALPRPWRILPRMPRRRSRPMRRRPRAHPRRPSRRKPSGSPPSRCWRRRQPLPASSPARPSPCARPRLPPSSWPRRRPRRPRRRRLRRPNGSKLITLEFKDADVINLLRILSAESGRNIVAGDDVKGKLSVSLRNVTWEQALDTILEVKGLQKLDKGGVIRIVSTEQLAKEREAQARADDAKRKAEIDARTKEAEAQLKEAEVANRKLQAELAAAEAQARGPLREEVIRLAYADPEDVAKTLQGILGIPAEGTQPVAGTPGVAAPGGPPLIAEPPFSALYGLGLQQQQQARPQVVSVSQDVLAKGLTIRANKATNSIFLRLYAADLERIKKLVRDYLDVPLPQVKIEARMEILDRTALEAIGIQWGGAGAGNVGKATVVGQGFQSPAQTPRDGRHQRQPGQPEPEPRAGSCPSSRARRCLSAATS